MTKHQGNLTITDENLADCLHITEVTGWLYIKADGASLPALTSVGDELYIRAGNASLPALTSVGGTLGISTDNVSLPSLTSVGGKPYNQHKSEIRGES